ncbi:MAG: UDP-3-O-[3-hydroxymyristoyl] N-acetylglucosamine deacetylase [Candidatus Deianiraeaceae bacterium]|jgi:UDP-3-O-[3-hydroxymyristoyl] N-acetylglucosamine deacetylase
MQEYSNHTQNSITFTGEGVHYGKNVTMQVIPQVSGGIVFKRTDISGDNEIRAHYTNVVPAKLNTTITNGFTSVATVEHLMAGLFGMQIKHAMILIDGSEVPLMDGGSSDFIFGLECLTIAKQETTVFELKDEVKVSLGDAYIIAKPCHTLKISSTVDFPHPCIGKQTYLYDKTKNNFKEEIAYAKTFGHITQIEEMQKNGLCLGGDMYSAIIFNDEKILSPEFAYNNNDFVQHKLLDFIGDIYLAGCDIHAEFECYKTSHHLNNVLLSKIFDCTDNS